MHKSAFFCVLAMTASAFAQAEKSPTAAPAPLDWKTLEQPLMRHQVQLTTRDKFVKAGEAYFSPDGQWIIFQAIAAPEEGKQADAFYAMYVAKLKRDRFTGLVSGLENIEKVSPDGSANTCGWFHPTRQWCVLFGSTLVKPHDDQKSGFQVGTRKYVWMFPDEMELAARPVKSILEAEVAKDRPGSPASGISFAEQQLEFLSDSNYTAVAVFARPNYDAECSYSPDGRFILYAHIEDHKEGEKPDANIYIYDTVTKKQHPVVTAKGYDGGPFFSPDGKSICYRSDRKGNDLLQLFVADLKFKDGVPVGIEKEWQLTDNEHVNWCPYWHPSGKYLVYGTSEVSHANYEVFAIECDMAALRAGKKPSELKHVRVTQADGADILPSFTNDGKLMMWTCQRGPKTDGEEKPSSQLWIAEWVGNPMTLPAYQAPATSAAQTSTGKHP